MLEFVEYNYDRLNILCIAKHMYLNIKLLINIKIAGIFKIYFYYHS